MKCQVTFRSHKFPAYEGEQEQINPGIWGKRLAEYLAQKLTEQGIKTGEIFSEDWGWYLPIDCKKHRLGLCCGHQDGDDDEFICFTDPAEPVVKKFFKKIDLSEELGRVVAALKVILESDSEIRDVVWG